VRRRQPNKDCVSAKASPLPGKELPLETIELVVGTVLVPTPVVDQLAAAAPEGVSVRHVPVPFDDAFTPGPVRAEWVKTLGEAHVFVGFPELLVDFVSHVPQLRWVQYFGAGYDRAPLRDLRAAGIGLASAAGAGAAGVAEFAVMAMLSLARKAPSRYEAQQRRQWQRFPARELHGRRATIVGAGAIGSRLCRLADALGMDVTCVRRHPEAGCPPGARRVVGPGELVSVLGETDVVVLAAALTDETEPLGPAAFAALPDGALLVNVGRGGLVDHDALLDALAGGRLGGAWLDTLPIEPLPPDHPLWTAPNVVISAHDASAVDSYSANVGMLALSNLRQWLAGEPMTNMVLPPGPPPEA
jgi:phosphoglycerate dehydrogenase-like enzyme